MCGRKYASEELTWAEYREILDITQAPPDTNLQPNYNIAPTHKVPVCIEQDGERSLELLQWGLLPHWAKDKKVGYKMINARSETLEEKASFKPLLESHRCIVPVSGFYEWKRDGKGKQAHKIEHADGRPMLLAGLWTENSSLGVKTYTVVTTGATATFEAIHNRMPAILVKDQIGNWLAGEWKQAAELLSPFGGSLSIVPVSNDVGNVKNNYPELLQSLN